MIGSRAPHNPMKKIVSILCLLGLLALTQSAPAQVVSITGTNLSAVLSLAGLSTGLLNNQLVKPGVPFSVNGETFLITSNSDGTYTVSSSGVAGSAAFTVPNTISGAVQTGQQWVAANNPSNIGYYATNELNARVGIAYLQSSGTAAAVLSVQKYGLISSQPGIGFGGGILEGNNGSQAGLAAAYAEADYRKPIGDVAANGGIVGGWDNWNRNPFVGLKAGLEYRQSAHLGEWLDVVGSYEPQKSDFPLMIAGGLEYSF